MLYNNQNQPDIPTIFKLQYILIPHIAGKFRSHHKEQRWPAFQKVSRFSQCDNLLKPRDSSIWRVGGGSNWAQWNDIPIQKYECRHCTQVAIQSTLHTRTILVLWFTLNSTQTQEESLKKDSHRLGMGKLLNIIIKRMCGTKIWIE